MESEAARDREREREREGSQSQERDHALNRLDETEVKKRMVAAFDHFVRLGFETHLVGVEQRGRGDAALVYKIVLTEDGGDSIPITEVQKIADEHRLDIFIEKGDGLVLHARW